jgi:L-lactate dehydrogenase complex protein LldG
VSARDEVLARVRQARGPEGEPIQVPRGYRQAGQGIPDASTLRDLLVDRLVDYRAGVVRCTEAEVGSVVAGILSRHGASRVVVPEGFPEHAIPSDLELVRDEPALAPEELDAVDGVLTTSAVAIAETGTIVLDAGPGMGRRALTLVPDLHVVLVRAQDVVLGVPEALGRLDPTRPLTWISGPSATSDIELNRVEGVHGPRRLEVLLVH